MFIRERHLIEEVKIYSLNNLFPLTLETNTTGCCSDTSPSKNFKLDILKLHYLFKCGNGERGPTHLNQSNYSVNKPMSFICSCEGLLVCGINVIYTCLCFSPRK